MSSPPPDHQPDLNPHHLPPQSDSQAEQRFIKALQALFELVQARHPEKGVASMLARARALADTKALPYAEALTIVQEEVSQRTYARLALLSHCPKSIQ